MAETVDRKTSKIVTFDDYGNPLALDTDATDSPVVEKTFSSLLKSNVLNGYRSYTYNFTLAVIDATAAGTYDEYTREPLKNIVLKSGGKGTEDTLTDAAFAKYKASNAQMEVLDRWDNEVKQKSLQANDSRAALEGFKSSSSGRFDLFIDDLRMTSVGSFTPDSGETLTQGLSFTVIEPYSVNGFIEALHAASLAAGYLNYREAHFRWLSGQKLQHRPGRLDHFLFPLAGSNWFVKQQNVFRV